MVFELVGYYNRILPNVKYSRQLQQWVNTEEEESTPEHEKNRENKLGTWQYLFIDLILVAMVSKCSLIMDNCTTSFHSIFFICVITGVIFLTRLYIDDYCNRFYVNDLFHRVLYFLYAMTLFVLTLNVNVLNIEEEEGLERSDANCKANIYGDAFEVAFISSRVLIMLLYGSVIHADKSGRAKVQFLTMMLKCGISAFVCTVLKLYSIKGDLFPPAYRMNIFAACGFVEMLFHVAECVATAHKHKLQGPFTWTGWKYIISEPVYPLNFAECDERLGAFIMIFCGEVMVTSLVQYYDRHNMLEIYPFTTVSMFVVFVYAFLYFESSKPVLSEDFTTFMDMKKKGAKNGITDEEEGGVVSAVSDALHIVDDDDADDSEAGHATEDLNSAATRPSKQQQQQPPLQPKETKETDNIPAAKIKAPKKRSSTHVIAHRPSTVGHHSSVCDITVELRRIKSNHASTHSQLSAFLYTWLHLIIALAVFFTTAGIGQVQHEITGNENDTAHPEPSATESTIEENTDDINPDSFWHVKILNGRWLLSLSLFTTLICLNVLHLLHRGLEQMLVHCETRTRFFWNIALAFPHMLMPFLNLDSGMTLCFLHGALLFASLLLDLTVLSKDELERREQYRAMVAAEQADEKAADAREDSLLSINDSISTHEILVSAQAVLPSAHDQHEKVVDKKLGPSTAEDDRNSVSSVHSIEMTNRSDISTSNPMAPVV